MLQQEGGHGRKAAKRIPKWIFFSSSCCDAELKRLVNFFTRQVLAIHQAKTIENVTVTEAPRS